jgi:hypothetical protein
MRTGGGRRGCCVDVAHARVGRRCGAVGQAGACGSSAAARGDASGTRGVAHGNCGGSVGGAGDAGQTRASASESASACGGCGEGGSSWRRARACSGSTEAGGDGGGGWGRGGGRSSAWWWRWWGQGQKVKRAHVSAHPARAWFIAPSPLLVCSVQLRPLACTREARDSLANWTRTPPARATTVRRAPGGRGISRRPGTCGERSHVTAAGCAAAGAFTCRWRGGSSRSPRSHASRARDPPRLRVAGPGPLDRWQSVPARRGRARGRHGPD